MLFKLKKKETVKIRSSIEPKLEEGNDNLKNKDENERNKTTNKTAVNI
jgi:hypothetical protein